MLFVLGLLIQEIVEIWRQGAFIYFSKWWNVVDTVIILTFMVAYVLWLVAWRVYGEWKPEKKSFIVADAIYASASVIAYFHLAHFFQVNSTLGPLQLSLYKMLRDVLKFLAIFLLSTLRLLLGWPRFTRTMLPLRESSKSGTPKPLTTNFLIHLLCEYSRISLDFSQRVVVELSFGFKLLLNIILFRA